MRNKMIRVSTKVMAAILVAASVITTTPIAHAEENPAVVEEVQVETEESTVVEETTETEEATEVEGQGDIIDDEFAYVEGQGDIIDDQFAVDPEAEAQPASESLILVDAPVIDIVMNEVEGQGDVIDDQFAVSEEAVEVTEDNTEVAATSVNSFVAVGSADEAQKSKDSVVVVFDPFNPIIPFKGVPTGNESENKSDVVETVETVNKFINPSDSVYGDPVRKVIDNCDVLGKDEKDYLKTCATLAIGSAEGLATGDYLPLWGAAKKVGKVTESLAKLHDSKTTTEVVANTIDVVTNTVEGAICAVPGGGLVLNAYKAQMALGSYCFKKACSFVNWLF